MSLKSTTSKEYESEKVELLSSRRSKIKLTDYELKLFRDMTRLFFAKHPHVTDSSMKCERISKLPIKTIPVGFKGW